MKRLLQSWKEKSENSRITNPEVCNALYISNGRHMCEITGYECQDYINYNCDLKAQITKWFRELRG